MISRLINAADGIHLWSERFDRNLDDVFAVQDEIAKAAVKRAGRSGQARTPGFRRAPENAEHP